MTRFVIIVLAALAIMSFASNFAKEKGEEIRSAHESRIEVIEKAIK